MQSAPTSSFVIPPDRGYPFFVTAKLYTLNDYPYNPEALTLFMLHSTSFFKEVYEPTLEELALRLEDPRAEGNIKVKEAWVVECPNHGESAVLNQELLKLPQYQQYFSCERYAEAAYRFLTSRDAHGRPYVNCPPEKLVGVGHSLGGVSMMFLSTKVQFASLVIVDPFVFHGAAEDLSALREKLVSKAEKRHNVWRSREEARRFFQKQKWDDRVLDCYVKYGLREYPAWNHHSMPDRVYTLACTREQEVTMYRDPEGATKPIPYLSQTCAKVPVHISFGKRTDVIPRYVQENLINNASCNFASVTWIDKVGHLVPQYAPQEVARVIHEAMIQDKSWRYYARL